MNDHTTPIYDGGHVIVWSRGDLFDVEIDDSQRPGGDHMGQFVHARSFERREAAIEYAERA